MMQLLDKLTAWRRQSLPQFHSRFGGLWIDRLDAESELAKRIETGKLAEPLGEKVSNFMRDGYVILPGAVSLPVVDRVSKIVTNGYANGDVRLHYHTDGAKNHILTAGTEPRGTRILEAHAVLGEIREALAAPPILAFLSAIFGEAPVLTQSLIFHYGSEQPVHQDSAFVVFKRPLCMAACWIALEDIVQGTGELCYIAKSHRLPDYTFSSGRLDSHGAEPGELERYLEWLVSESERRGLERNSFLAKKGDVLIWHGGLAHGGSPITVPSATRQSLVGHFCAVSTFPRYPGARNRRRHGSLRYSSTFFQTNLLQNCWYRLWER